MNSIAHGTQISELFSLHLTLLLTSFSRVWIQQLSALFYSLLLLCLLCNREERVLTFGDTFVLLCGVNRMYLWMHCGCPIPGSVQGQVGWGFEQPALVEGVPAHGRGVGTR